MFAQQSLRTRNSLFMMPQRVLDLHDVIRHGLAVRRFVLQFLEDRQGLLVFLLFVETVTVVIRTAGSIARVRFAELTEVDRSLVIVLLHEVGIAAIEGVIQLVRTGQGFQVDGLQGLQALFILAFLHLQHSLHELHFVRKSGIRKSLQIGLQILRQLLVAHLKACR